MPVTLYDHTHRRVDDSLRFVVTSFKCKPIDVTGLNEPKLNAIMEEVLKPRDWLDRCHNRSHKAKRVHQTETVFLGIKRNPAQSCYATELPIQLASRGLVPLGLRIYIKGWTCDDAVLRVNIFWSKPAPWDDQESTAEKIELHRKLFMHLQRFAWNVKGTVFTDSGEPDTILLNFHTKIPNLPPTRRSKIIIDDNDQITVTRV